MADALLGFTLNGANVGNLTEEFSAVIGGSTRRVRVEDLTISPRLSGPSTATVFVRGFTPSLFADIQLYNGGSGGIRLFGGTVVNIAYDAVRMGDDPWHRLDCQDYTWLADRYTKVNARYSDCGVNTALHRLVASFTNGGFRVGYCPSTLGDVWDVAFENATVTQAVDELAQQAGGFWTIDADKRINIFADTAMFSSDGLSVSDSSKNFVAPNVASDGREIATRVVVLGAGSQTTATVVPTATTIPVEDVLAFRGESASSGSVIAGEQVLTYTGVSVTSGPGNLTGVSGLTKEIPQGTLVRFYVMAEDASAQTTLATALGGGLSGIATLKIETDAGRDLATAIATAELAKRKTTFTQLQYTTYDQTHTGASRTIPGQTVSVSLTAPTSVSGTYRVQAAEISMRPGGRLAGTALQFQRRVTLAPYFKGLNTARRLARVN